MRKKPIVTVGDKRIPFTYYQLCQAKFALSIMKSGMKMRHVNVSDIRKLYGLKGRTAADLLPRVEALIEKYKQETAPLLNTNPQ